MKNNLKPFIFIIIIMLFGLVAPFLFIKDNSNFYDKSLVLEANKLLHPIERLFILKTAFDSKLDPRYDFDAGETLYLYTLFGLKYATVINARCNEELMSVKCLVMNRFWTSKDQIIANYDKNKY